MMPRAPENTLIMELKTGSVTIALRPDLAPAHVARIKQTGDPTGTGMGGSKLPDLKAEFSTESHKRGTCSMARSANPHSANSQFFVCFEPAPWLDRQYSIWGEVVEGMEHIDAVKKGSMQNNGAIDGEPDKILKMRVAADA
jgi:cyclophilin family peptidyl-prolyl cis-trans isomerase